MKLLKRKEYENKIKKLELKINENENEIKRLTKQNIELLTKIDTLKNKFIELPENGKLLKILLHRIYHKYDYESKEYVIIIELKYNKRIVYSFKDKKDMEEKYNNIIKQI